jgi:hypothetical protein
VLDKFSADADEHNRRSGQMQEVFETGNASRPAVIPGEGEVFLRRGMFTLRAGNEVYALSVHLISFWTFIPIVGP